MSLRLGPATLASIVPATYLLPLPSHATVTLQEFADKHGLPRRWVALRRQCEAIITDPQYWSRPDLQDEVRRLATEASDILRERSQQKNVANTHRTALR